MAEPRFSVVVPTRERAGTLRVALRTCLEQDFADYEVVVCDNHGSPATRHVVEEYNSPKIRYIRSPRLLSMSSNWELAVSEARGEYVLVLGDDDGLLFHGLRELDRLIGRDRPPAVRWSPAYYTWPSIDLPGQANYLRLPLGRDVRAAESVPAIDSVVRFQSCYTTLPMLYNSAVRRDLIDGLREHSGRVFANHYPDVYSGFALGYLCGEYLSLDAPMTIAGSSGDSFGVANLFHRGKSPRDHEFRTLNAEEGLPTHRWVPDLPVFPYVPVADSFQLAKEALFPEDGRLRLDRRALAAHCVSALRADDEDEWQTGLAAVRATFDDDSEAQSWFDETLSGAPFRPAGAVQLRSARLGYEAEFLHLGTDRFGVEDVYGAAQLCERILAYRDVGICYGSQAPPAAVHSKAEQAALLLQEGDPRLWTIPDLHAAAEERRAMIDALDGQARQALGVVDERLALIYRLDEELRRAQGAAEERLALIRRLDEELRRTQGAAAERLATIQSLEARLSRPLVARIWSRLRRALGGGRPQANACRVAS